MDMEAYRNNTAAQYEALGRFVEAFEAMVHEVRVGCTNMLSYDLPGRKARLIAIPFHHQAFTASPLMEVLRAILMEVITDPEYQTDYSVTEDSVEKFSGVLGAIQGEYNELLGKRNGLLHGTWLVGYRGPSNPDAETFYVRKYKTSGSGLVAVDLPKSAPELDDLCIRCDETRTWIAAVLRCLPTSNGSLSIERCFKKSGNAWERVWPTPHKFPTK